MLVAWTVIHHVINRLASAIRHNSIGVGYARLSSSRIVHYGFMIFYGSVGRAYDSPPVVSGSRPRVARSDRPGSELG